NAQCTELFFSEYVEGSNNNKALEIYNPTTDTIVMDNVYQIVRFSNGATNSDQDIRYVQPLTGYVPPYGTYVAILDRRDPAGTGVDTILYPVLLFYGSNNNADFYSPDYNSGTQGARVLPFNGDDAITLEKYNGATYDAVDIFGLVGEQPQTSTGGTGAGWTNTPDYWNGIGAYWTRDQTLLRKQSVQQGVTTNPGIPYAQPGNFNPTLEWDSLPRNFFANLGCHKCNCDPNVNSVACISGPLSVAATSVMASCKDSCDGTATAAESNAALPVTYDWSDGQTSATAVGLCAGTYTVTVTDANTATATTTVTVGQPTAVDGAVVATQETSAGADDGTATATGSGGTPGYNYLWNDPGFQTNAMATGLAPGTYTVAITDSNGCTATVNTIVNNASCALSGTISVVNESSLLAGDGSATITPVDGTPPFAYQWDDPGTQTTATATGLGSGTYTITLIDSAGCAYIAQATVSLAVGLHNILGNAGFELYPNPLNDHTFFVESEKSVIGIEVYNLTGQVMHEEEINSQKGAIKIDLKDSSSGIYLVRVKFENDQVEIQKLIIN
ncbi:MAG TPA: T9SS type A sorting domain-containing protein, partial [Flavobacteriales bacterium]|nr:T9SS type A sorting domain-containing protein [Flavobacteriales bacterium]